MGFKMTTTSTAEFQVKYYDAKLRGSTVRTASFTDRAEAEAFAAGRVVYSKPAKVIEIFPEFGPYLPICPNHCGGEVRPGFRVCFRCFQAAGARRAR